MSPLDLFAYILAAAAAIASGILLVALAAGAARVAYFAILGAVKRAR